VGLAHKLQKFCHRKALIGNSRGEGSRPLSQEIVGSNPTARTKTIKDLPWKIHETEVELSAGFAVARKNARWRLDEFLFALRTVMELGARSWAPRALVPPSGLLPKPPRVRRLPTLSPRIHTRPLQRSGRRPP
jgi:hypothetical protein